MSNPWVLRGARAPEALTIHLLPSASVPDLTVVTAATIEVTAFDGTAKEWTPSLGTPAADALTLTHEFAADGTDVPTAGPRTLLVHLTTTTGPRRAGPFTLDVRGY